MSEELTVIEHPGFMAPVIAVKDALTAYQAKKDLIDGIMKKDVDFGVIPGSSKPTLLKAGAEKATSFFGLFPRFVDAEVVNDWTGEQHGGEPFFYYRRTCNLYRGNVLVASVDGSCNSWEKKYRYRSSERVCPECGKATIIKGKQEYGGGWLCLAKKGGCGAKFPDGAPEIVNQEVGTIKNPDVADQVNTILKMADKRALVAATLIATGLSEYFTQDVEDYIDGSFTESTAPVKQPAAPVVVEVKAKAEVKADAQSGNSDDLVHQEFRHKALWKRVSDAGLLNQSTLEIWRKSSSDTAEMLAGKCALMHAALGDK
jgi:ssDNA-binding Zn-finger/Zn-ribbon topoisomerase 1